ncbi:MAG TPA: hypothetical protein VJ813_21450 [Vicinamibacterales bacterium]|nr:hypothetical protein [Vicinamibacterales bacterium]
MPIKPSGAAEIRALVAALSSDDEVRRESAVARLAIIGGRAMDRLTAAYASADRHTRLAILRTAERIADPRALSISLEALAAGGDLAVAAASTLRSLLDSPLESAATRALDALVATAVDTSAARSVRMAALDALQDMPPAVRERVAEVLREETHPGPTAHAALGPRDAAAPAAVWQDAVDGTLPEDPAAVGEAVRGRAATAPLSILQKLVEAVRAREGESAPAGSREAWQQVRGALHQALALRGSRVALYDLRETLAQAREPLPAAFLAAAHVIGDESCLEPIAAAWTAADDARWRHQLEAAFRVIVKRQKISRRGAVLNRVEQRFPEAAAAVSTPSRTTPRPKTRGRTSRTAR